jgi:hypothetical protein
VVTAIEIIGPVDLADVPGGGTDNTVWVGDPPAVGVAGGLDMSYQDLDPTMYVGLGFALREDPAHPEWFVGIDLNDANFADGQEKLQYSAALSDPTNGIAVYTGSSQLVWSGPQTNWQFRTDVVGTRLTLTAVDGVTETLDAATMGVNQAAQVFYPVDGESFIVNALAEAQDPRDSSYTPIFDLWDSLNTDPTHHAAISFAEGFWYAIPEPGTALLLTVGVLTLVVASACRRRGC